MNNHRKYSWLWFSAGFLTGAAASIWVILRRSRAQGMPYLNEWERALRVFYSEASAAALAQRIQERYADLYTDRPRFPNSQLREHLEQHILPGLALYQVLLEELEDKDIALARVEDIFASTPPVLAKVTPLLGYLPDPFHVFKALTRWVLPRGYPAEGWDMEIIEDNENCFAFDTHRCFYLDTLTSYGMPELTPLYCAMDDLWCEALPSTITWERTKTLGRGDDVCDFRWCRAKESIGG